ncbi:hypothetical protein EJ04DRAFT_552701 [Polyplosphaeria fusca]|uniref:Effector 5 protein n=1 Tax=Polyplosphaeria fusca TaxID=682080 RepID=A0A9P4V2Q7_9PLEO|nr:hypothetical protein EJ04DRAFT_552701 [Polyplosphaeria fusca]
MRYSSALVLGTFAAGQAAAANVRHASFHARRQQESKRDMADVDWSKVSYDLSGVDWSSVFATTEATPTPTPTSSEVKVEVAAEPTSSADAPKYTPPPAPTSEEEAKPTETEAPHKPGNIVNDILSGVDSLIKKIGICATGENSDSDNGKIWIGDDSRWTVNFVNNAEEDVVVFCWADAGFTGMTLNVNKPLISASLKPGASQTISWAGGYSSACAPVYPDTVLANFGGIQNSWFEVTFPTEGVVGSGAFDISRNVNMNGNTISAQGSKCKSDMDTCVFKCKSGGDSCTYGYDLYNCDAGNGGGGGYDAAMGGTGGGCGMDSDKESITVSFS